MEKKIISAAHYIGVVYGDVFVDDLINMLVKAKESVCEYTNVIKDDPTKSMRVEFTEDDGDLEMHLRYYRYESDREYRDRIEKENKKEEMRKADLHKMIKSDVEETIAYLKSIGAI